MTIKSEKPDSAVTSLVLQIISSALNLEPSKISTNAGIGTLDEWDSLAHMRIIMGLEEALDTVLPMEAIVEISDMTDIERLIIEQPNQP